MGYELRQANNFGLGKSFADFGGVLALQVLGGCDFLGLGPDTLENQNFALRLAGQIFLGLRGLGKKFAGFDKLRALGRVGRAPYKLGAIAMKKTKK